MTPRDLQTLRNMGNEAEEAADEIDRLRAELERLRAQEPVAYVAHCIADGEHCIEGEFDFSDVTEKPFEVIDGALWECAALYLAAPQAQPAEPDMRHPKIQALIGGKARCQIELRLVEQLLEDPHFETTSMDMEYWGPMHDQLKERLTAQPAQPAEADLRGAVARGWCHPENAHKEMDSELVFAIADEVQRLWGDY